MLQLLTDVFKANCANRVASLFCDTKRMKMKKVIIYTKDPCPYCVRAINFMNDKGIVFDEIDLTESPDEIDRIKNETGWRTVPIIMIGDKLIGGYTDMKALDESGQLMPLINS